MKTWLDLSTRWLSQTPRGLIDSVETVTAKSENFYLAMAPTEWVMRVLRSHEQVTATLFASLLEYRDQGWLGLSEAAAGDS